MLRRYAGFMSLFALGAALVMIFNGPATAKGQKKKKEPNREIHQDQRRLNELERDQSRLNQQIEHLEKSLPSARDSLKKSQDELHTHDGKLDKVRDAYDAAKLKVKQSTEQLAAIVKQVEDSQPSTSPFAQAKAAYLAAKEAYDQAVDRVANSPNYQAAYQQATAADDRATLLPAVRKKWIDENPDVAQAQGKAAAAKAIYERLLSELLHKSPQWVQANDVLEQAKKAESEREKELRSVSAKVAALKKSVEQMQADVKKKDASLERDRSELRKTSKKIDALRDEIRRDRNRNR